MADAKRSPEDRRAKMYDKSGEKMGGSKAPEKKAEPAAKKDGEGDGEDKGAKAAADYKAMMKRHESERRDAHGAHKDNLRKIATRHEKEIKDMMQQNMGGGADTDASADGGDMADKGGDE